MNAGRVFLIGQVPPPIGGINVHVERLMRLLTRNGYTVRCYDFTKLPFARKAALGESESKRSEGSFLQFCRDFCLSPPALIHVHVSAMRRAGFALPLLLPLSLLRHCVVTIHSGQFPQYFRAAKPIERGVVRGFLRSVSAIIAVNDEIRNCLISDCGVAQDRIVTIPAFLPLGGAETARELPPVAGKPVAIAAGYGTPLYFWEGLLEAMNGSRRFGELRLCFYGLREEPYFSRIKQMAQTIKLDKVSIHEDLSPQEFHELMRSSTVFVRPTHSDGDSVAVREALSLGKMVVASDVIRRPDGCALFRSGDVNSLRETLHGVPLTRAVGNSPVSSDFGERIINLYREVGAR